MVRHMALFVIMVVGLLSTLAAAADPQARAPEKKDAAPRSRSFLFTYGVTVTGLPAGKVARIWLPVPRSSEDQDVQIISKQLPAEGQISHEPNFGNMILYVEAKVEADGKIPLEVTYRVTRREVKSSLKTPSKEPERLAFYLKPDAKVPISGKPLKLIKDKVLPKEQVAAARVLYDVVNDHMRYSKEGTGWGQGDAVWACESGYGNCSDFHSLFISLARSQKIPAKFEIGFPLPPQRGSGEIAGYHCWAKFHPQGNGWVPVDISEANKNPKMKDYYFGNLTEDRLTFSTGRDINLVPQQDGPPLNFFVYPYVEVDGKPYAEKVLKQFSYKDVAAGQQQSVSANGPADNGWMNLFNGNDLDGWLQRGGKAKYRVENGQIVGSSVPGKENSFLCTDKDYSDFILELEFKVDPSLNSGVQIRSHCFEEAKMVELNGKKIKIPAGRVHGYQVEIDPSSRAWTGGIYDEGRRGWLVDLKNNEPARKAFKQGEWNKFRIECRGDSIKTWLNGVPAADLKDSVTPSGFIGLQVHGVGKRQEPLEVRFRNLRIKELK